MFERQLGINMSSTPRHGGECQAHTSPAVTLYLLTDVLQGPPPHHVIVELGV